VVLSTLFASFVVWSFSPFFRDSGSGGGGGGKATVEQQQQQQQQQRSTLPSPSPPPTSTSSSPSAPVLPAFLRNLLPALQQPKFYTCVLYGRVLSTLCCCQLLRALSFLSTSLPGPNYHCRAGSPAATLPMPRRWYGHLLVDVGEQATKGCGDLIFSSHTTFALVGCLSYQSFGNFNLVKKALWVSAVALSLLIVASRKHYTVDVVIAWYVVPLVWSFASRRWTTPERRSGSGSGSGNGSGSGGEKSKTGGSGGLKQGRKGGKGGGRPDRPSSVITVSSGFGFNGDVESGGGGFSSCGRCPSCGGGAKAGPAAG